MEDVPKEEKHSCARNSSKKKLEEPSRLKRVTYLNHICQHKIPWYWEMIAVKCVCSFLGGI